MTSQVHTPKHWIDSWLPSRTFWKRKVNTETEENESCARDSAVASLLLVAETAPYTIWLNRRRKLHILFRWVICWLYRRCWNEIIIREKEIANKVAPVTSLPQNSQVKLNDLLYHLSGVNRTLFPGEFPFFENIPRIRKKKIEPILHFIPFLMPIMLSYSSASTCCNWIRNSWNVARKNKLTENVNASVVLLAAMEYAAKTHIK